MIRFRAEWEAQSAVMIAWPHSGTDWAGMLDRVQACYRDIAHAIAADEPLIVVTPEPDTVREQLADIDPARLTIVNTPTNDTWTRDYGPLSVDTDQGTRLLDFTFNAWGMKFAANHDNLVTQRLAAARALPHPIVSERDMVLEGGSVESDGRGTVMTTAYCLMAPNRNEPWSIERVELELKSRLGARKVLWLEHGYLPGDDTDGHIDTLARFLPGGVIVYATARYGDEEYAESHQLGKQLVRFTDVDGNRYKVIPLPAPEAITDADGHRLPATYANFLITNHSVLVPTYGCLADGEALRVLQSLLPDRRAVPIDCRPLIEQHGSLHCATMQIAI